MSLEEQDSAAAGADDGCSKEACMESQRECAAETREGAGSKDDETRRSLDARTQQALNDADLMARTLNEINGVAAKLQKQGDLVGALSTYRALFTKARRLNLTHPELYVCHCNCAGAYLSLELYDEALRHAEYCRQLAEASLRRNFRGSATYIKAFVRKGQALLALGRHREAVSVFEEALKMDSFNFDLKKGLQEANAGILQDLVEGKGRETRAITYPQSAQRISYHPYAAPLHKIRTDDMLPIKLLTPFQAENDHHIKDTYNYVTVQTDVKMPKRHLRFLEDACLNSRFEAAICLAVKAIEDQDMDCRVLNLGAGAGLHAMMALRAGAFHVTAVERWLYLALACKEVMVANKFEEDKYQVVYKRPTDLALGADVPICCNLVIANIFDEGLLTSGLIPAVSHALASLATSDAIVLPASATVYMQAVEMCTGEVCGLDMSAANLYRWHPAYAAGVPLAQQGIVPLSEPVEVWYFDMLSPPEKSDTKTVDIHFNKRGRFNAVMFWFKLHLFGDVYICTGLQAVQEGLRCLQPAVQYMAGELPVDEGLVIPLMASHNTVRMRFDIESADYLHLMKPDASFPPSHFSMLADSARAAAYQRAIARAVDKRKQQDGEAHVLDMGTGSGLLAMFAAKAGASSVVACDLHESLCDVARKAAAANGLSQRVSVVHRDVGLLQRGKEVRPLGVNLVVADMFDSGLFGNQFAYLLELVRKRVVQPGAAVVPSAATLYCCGIEALTGQVAGFDFSQVNKYRWEADYEQIDLGDLPHRRLTKPTKVFEYFFDREQQAPRGRDSLLKLEVIAPGTLNAIAFWFDLHLDDIETLTNAPEGICEGGELLEEPEASVASTPAVNDATARSRAVAEPVLQDIINSSTEHAVSGQTATPAEPAICQPRADSAAPKDQAQTELQLSGEDFQPAEAFQGARPGYVFKLGEAGLGYHADLAAIPAAVPAAAQQAKRGGLPAQQATTAGAAPGSSAQPAGQHQQPQLEKQQGEGQLSLQEQAAKQEPLPRGPRHHWGQALQYLDMAVRLEPGRKVTLLAKRDGATVRFALRQGVGEWVERAPWRIEWGGGASVENPHYQRVHYCELLVRDFLMRVKSKRFPTIEKDMRMVLAHAGSLFLDPAALQEVYHELVVMEKIHTNPEFCPGASLEALTRRPLRLH